MDLEIAEPAADTPLSRRSLVTRACAASLAGLAAALVIDRSAPVSAAAPDELPNLPTESDAALLERMMRVELAANALYRSALENASDDLAVVTGVLAENHLAYAQAIAGITGLSAQGADEELIAEYEPSFTGQTEEYLASAHTLEQALVATQTELVGVYESSDAITLTASIATVEARQATVIAELLGVEDLDVLFGNDQSPLELTGDDA